MLKERSFAVNQTVREKEEIQRQLSQKQAMMNNIDQSREQIYLKLSQVEEKSRILRQRIAEKQAREGAGVNSASGIIQSKPVVMGQPPLNNYNDLGFSNQPTEPVMQPQQGGYTTTPGHAKLEKFLREL